MGIYFTNCIRCGASGRAYEPGKHICFRCKRKQTEHEQDLESIDRRFRAERVAIEKRSLARIESIEKMRREDRTVPPPPIPTAQEKRDKEDKQLQDYMVRYGWLNVHDARLSLGLPPLPVPFEVAMKPIPIQVEELEAANEATKDLIPDMMNRLRAQLKADTGE